MCKASKCNDENADLSYAYSNISEGAAWRRTYWTENPYEIAPSFMALPGFSLQMLAPDILHAYHLGLGRDLVGSALRELTRTSILFEGRTIALRLRVATERFQDFVREHAYSVSIRKFTTKNLAFGKGFPELRAKGYDTFVIIRWLLGELQANPAASQSFATLSTAV